MADRNWSPAPEAVEAAGRAALARGSTMLRATMYARNYLVNILENEPEDADMAAAELEDVRELVVTLIYTLLGFDPDDEDLPDLPEDDWNAVQGWLLGQFPD